MFLPNYDIAMAQTLYPGCDVWLNNPLRPLEACGTSGMKAALNGCLNLSVLDGWWDEWYDGHNGWAIPTADGVTDPDHRDDLEAGALYDLLEKTVAPLFYDRDADGLPARWIEMVRHTLQTLGPKVLATRMVRDYVARALRARRTGPARALDGGFAGARELAAWKARVRAAWPSVRVDHVEAAGVDDAPEVGSTLEVRAFVSLGQLSPEDVEVQVVHGRVDEHDQIAGLVRGVDAPRGGLRGRSAPVRRHRRPRPAGPVRLHRPRRAAPPPGGDPGRARAGRAARRERRHGLRRPPVARAADTRTIRDRVGAVAAMQRDAPASAPRMVPEQRPGRGGACGYPACLLGGHEQLVVALLGDGDLLEPGDSFITAGSDIRAAVSRS